MKAELSSRTIRSAALRTTAISGLLVAFASGAYAQTQTAQVEEIVVTGSRVDRSGFVAPTPLTVVGAEELQNAAVTNIADQLNKAPAFQQSQAPQNVGTGSQRDPTANFLNLRGLGANRTLVLVDGRRHVPNSASGTVDTNLIPFALVERTDVVTGGASAAYGSDAVAGVVNFIIDKDYEGIKGSFQGGMTDLGDDHQVAASLAFGKNFMDGRLNIAVAAQYVNIDETAEMQDREWGRDDWKIVTNTAYTATNGQYRLIAAPDGRFSAATDGGLIIANAGTPLRGIQFGPGGASIPFQYGTSPGATFMIGGGNEGELLDLTMRPGVLGAHRNNIYGRAGYQITENVNATIEATYAEGYGHSQITRSSDLGAGGSILVQRDNAYLPENIRQLMIANNITNFRMGRLNPEFGFIRPQTRSTTKRFVGSLDGDFEAAGTQWSWNTYFQIGRTKYNQVYLDNRNTEKWVLAVDAVRNASGQVVCRSTLTTPNNGCIPANVFGNGSLNQTNVADYVLEDPYSNTWSKEDAAAFNISGEPFDLWAGPVSIALGGEWRREWVKTVADADSNRGIYRVGNIIDQFGTFKVAEGYVETVVPLMKDETFARSLDLNAAARITDYSVSGSVSTWKVGLTYEPIDTVRFRVAKSRDIRAPNIVEFFQAPRLNSGGTVIDRATGIQYAPRTRTGGNTALTPEKADTTTYGVVWSPDGALSGLRASVDRWEIYMKDAIATVNSQNTIDYCFAGNTSLCSFIERDATGAITLVGAQYVNVGYIKTSGIDYEVAYNTPFPIESVGGDLDFRFLATWTEKYVTSDGGRNISDTAGSLARMDWKVSTRLTYTNGAFRIYAENQFVPKLALDATYTEIDLPLSQRILPSMNWTNVSLSYDVMNEGSRRVQIFTTINNIFDQNPPITPNTGVTGSQSDAGVYDILGRRYQVGLRFSY